MTQHQGSTLSWQIKDGALELVLHHPPANEIGSAMLAELEMFIRALGVAESRCSAVIVYSRQPCRLFGRRRPARAVRQGAAAHA